MTIATQKGEREEALERISRLRRLLASSTPAPWQAMMHGNAPLLDGTVVGQARLVPVPRPYQPRWVGFQNEATAHEWHHATVMREEDAEFVAAMRNNAPWLLDTIERLLSSAKAEGEMREAGQAMLDDHMTSDAHHPFYVLVPAPAFEKVRAALTPKEGE